MTFYHPNAKELKDFYNSQKRITEYILKADKSSGVIGTPKVDSDKFDKVINLLEDLETQLLVYAESMDNVLQSQFAINPASPDKVLKLLINTTNVLASNKFSLDAIASEDVDKFRGYLDFMQERLATMETIRDFIEAEVAKPPPDNLAPDLARPFQNIVTEIIRYLTSIISSMIFDIQRYDSGTVQPVRLGGGLRYNLDEPLKYSAMYQTPPTRYL